jgi:hypothetical protein
MAVQLIELLEAVSVQMEGIMLENGIPAEMAKADVATFMRAGTGALSAKVETPIKQNDWQKSPLLADAVTKFVDSKLSRAVPELVTAMLCCNKLYLMPTITIGGFVKTAAEMRDYLSKIGVILKTDKEWKPEAGFADKNLFGCSSFIIKSKGKISKQIHTLKVTFKGKCFISVLLTHPELGPMDAYFKTFPEEII